MNKQLEKFGEYVAEKPDRHWALTGFVVEIWGEERIKLRKNATRDC